MVKMEFFSGDPPVPVAWISWNWQMRMLKNTAGGWR